MSAFTVPHKSPLQQLHPDQPQNMPALAGCVSSEADPAGAVPGGAVPGGAVPGVLLVPLATTAAAVIQSAQHHLASA